MRYEGEVVTGASPPDALVKEALVCVAGRLSEQLFLKDKFWEGSSYDEFIAFQLWANAAAGKAGEPVRDFFSKLWQHAGEILRKRQHAVRRIAEGLMRRPRLNQIQIVRAIGDA